MSVHSNDGIKTWSTKLKRISVISGADKRRVFSNLGHIISIEMLRDMYNHLDGKKTIGIDGVTKEIFGQNLEANLVNLLQRIRRGTYRPRPARIVEIPKEDGSTRPLAIACLEDKLVQSAVSAILSAIYEPIFLPCSYGFRPKLGCHDALRAMNQAAFKVSMGAIVEIDIRKYFNSIPHELLLKMIRAKISDHRFVWLLETLLRSPTIDLNGIVSQNEIGSPQGSIVSPVLANIFLHYVLDEWFAAISANHFVDTAWEIRYADDCVFIFKNMSDADRFYRVLDKRLNKYGIDLHDEKSQLLPAGDQAAARAKGKGTRIPTFKFLGFTCYWGLSRNKRRWRLKLKSRSDRKRSKLRGLRDYLRKNRTTDNVAKVLNRVIAGVRGWISYHAVSDNGRAVGGFLLESTKMLFQWFNRRGKRGTMNWERLNRLLVAFNFPKMPKIVNLFSTPNQAPA